jgi:hypothetical protein
MTLAAPVTNSTQTITLPDATGTVMVSGNMPSFRATLSANQTVTANTNTKIAFNVETWDTASCFNNTGSTVGGIPAYSFLPNVAGYYQVNCILATSGAVQYFFPILYLNTTSYASGSRTDTPATQQCYAGVLSDMVYLNGTTDYISFYGYTSGTTYGSGTGSDGCKFSASLVRSA